MPLLKPGILIAVLAGSAIAILGQFMGVNAVLYYGPKIFSQAGFDNPMFSTVLVGLVNMVTTILAVFIIDKVGRKQLIYWGVSGVGEGAVRRRLPLPEARPETRPHRVQARQASGDREPSAAGRHAAGGVR